MMKGLLLKDLYMAKSNILVTIVSLIVLGFGLSVLLEASALLVLAPHVPRQQSYNLIARHSPMPRWQFWR